MIHQCEGDLWFTEVLPGGGIRIGPYQFTTSFAEKYQ